MAADLLIKICGITNLEDAQRAVDFGADALGFVFVPASPRYITVDTAASIISRLPSALGKVGVFVNESRQNIHSVIDRTGITHVQLHGDESPEDTTQFSLPVWKAFRVSPAFAVSSLSPYHPSAFLLDAFSNDAYGGTGRTFDWNLAVQAKQFGRIILSGGLNPQNAAEAVQRVRPYGIDVNSGVEDSPGKKDKRKLQNYFQYLRMWEFNMTMKKRRAYASPTAAGYYGTYGGRYVPETLIAPLQELEALYTKAKRDPNFQAEYLSILHEYAGRPTPLTYVDRLTNHYGRAKIFLKREDLCHTGAHKINNVVGQILLARKLGKSRIIAETGAGQHGVATATVAAKFGLQCVVYMGEEDVRRQALNVYRMTMLGAQVVTVTNGSRTLKDATSEAIRDWVTNVRDTFYVIGSVVGPHPYPMMVRDFQSIIGRETTRQLARIAHRLPSHAVACVGGGSNAMGMFYPLIHKNVQLFGVEAAGFGLDTDKHAATITKGRPGVLHGTLSYLLQDADGQVALAHSVSAGLDYPGVGPEHSGLKDSGRVTYASATDEEALCAAQLLSQLEGIIPALESSHALAYLETLMPRTRKNDVVVVCLSGRGDKDMGTYMERLK